MLWTLESLFKNGLQTLRAAKKQRRGGLVWKIRTGSTEVFFLKEEKESKKITKKLKIEDEGEKLTTTTRG